MFFKKRANTERVDRVAKLYLAYKFFGALFFAYPVFYQFASQTITPVQVGIFFSVIGICGFIAEIPTGIIADKRDRKSSGLFGTILLIAAPLIVFFGHTFPAYLIAAVFYGVGRAFLSGALESLVYDHKNVSRAVYRRVNVLEITYGQAGILVSAACGGFLFSLQPSLPFITEAIAGLICLALIAAMQENNKADYIKPTASHRQHFAQSVRHLFATAYLRILVLMGITFSVMLGMCIQFVNEAAMIEHNLQPDTRGFLIAGAGITTLIILNLVLLKVLKGDVERILYLAGGAVIAYALMAADVMSLFLLGYLLWCCLNATSSFVKVMVHDHIPSSHRSTITSNFKALAILIGLGGSTTAGLLVQSTGTPRAAYTVFAIISCFVLLPCAYWLITHQSMSGLEPRPLSDSN
ncbi:major facilitator superfamily MFS_1 [candidate division TM7 genomosp. GTL1]|nr:major facilitator superfamily MFS_1 [candidate division TM7 genomosp. GTL1]